MKVVRHLPTANGLGEGVLWDHRQQRLVWVDIPNHMISWCDEGSSEAKHVTLPEMPGFVVLHGDGGYMVGAGQSIYRLDVSFALIGRAVAVESMAARTRMNDGKVDRNGNLVFGSSHLDETAPIGASFFKKADSCHRFIDAFTVFNGPAFSPVGDRIYFTDSPTRVIKTAKYDPEAGHVVGLIDIFAVVPADAGYPDGMAVDGQGCLWSAHWDGGRMTRYRPDGAIEREIALPVHRPTSICFGGRDGKTIFVTSAALDTPVPRRNADDIVDGDVLRLAGAIAGIQEKVFNHEQ